MIRLYFKKLKRGELESSNEEKPETKKEELEGMARNLREKREIERLLTREGEITRVARFLSGRYFPPLSPLILMILLTVFPPRWAAKEAITKAHYHRRITLHDIEITTPAKNYSDADADTGSLPPVAVVKSEEGDEHPYREVQVSISHDGNYATATALVCEPSPVN